MVNARIISSGTAAALCFSAGAMADSVSIDFTARDFRGSFTSSAPFTPVTGGHPHFEIFTIDPSNPFGPSRIPPGYGGILGLQAQISNVEPGIVTNQIGPDRKPVWQGGSNPALFATTKTRVNAAGTNLEIEPDDNVNRANFNKWFNNDPLNTAGTVSLVLNDPENDGVFTYENLSFFPLDEGQPFSGFGNEGRAHNQHFTLETHQTFTYQPGQIFRFIGDDDVWVYINDQRVIDLGGVHQQETGEVNLDTLGLTPGNTYNFDFFFAERNTFQSNFRIETSIRLGEDGGPPPVIPLPAAAWMGLTTLGGMGVFSSLRRRFRSD